MGDDRSTIYKDDMESIYNDLRHCYNEGSNFVERELLATNYGTTEGETHVFPYWHALYDPKEDTRLSILLQMMMGGSTEILSRDKTSGDKYFTELLVVNPNDVYFWANISRKYDVSSSTLFLSKPDAALVWKFVRFKIRNFKGIEQLKQLVDRNDFPEVLENGQASFTVGMTKELKDHSLMKATNLFGPALVSRGFRKSVVTN